MSTQRRIDTRLVRWIAAVSRQPQRVAVALLLATLCGYRADVEARRPAQGSTPPSASRPAATAAKRALLIGIDKYKNAGNRSGLRNLAGCANDAENMRAVLVGKFEFPDDAAHLRLLKNEAATHSGIVDAIEQHLIAPSAAGDVVVIYFAGHGSQAKNPRRINGFDETIVPHDSRDAAATVFDITGDEISALVDRISAKTPNVTVIFDSCQSGTLLQPGAFRARSAREGYPRVAPPDTRPQPAPAATARGAGFKPSTSRWTFLAAARADEFAKEYNDHGQREGAFTRTLVSALRSAPAGATYRDIMDVVGGRVTELFGDQHPQLEGVGDDAFVFGDGGSLADTYIRVKPTPQGGELVAGSVLNVTVGSVYEVYPPGTKTFPAGGGAAKLQVTSVSPFSAQAQLLAGATVPPDARAVERDHRYDKPQMRLVVAPDTAPLPAIRQALSTHAQVAVIDPAAATPVDLTLGIANGRIELRGLSEPAPLFTAPASANAVEPTVEVLLAWAQWLNLRQIANPASPLKVRLDAAWSDPAAQPSGVKSGTRVTFTLRNDSLLDLYISLVDFSTDGSRTVLYPPAGSQPKLQAGQSFMLPAMPVSVPAGRLSVSDTVKLFATVEWQDFRALIAEPIPPEMASRGPIDDLFFVHAGGKRNVGVVSLGTWSTAERVFTVTQ